MLKLAKPKRLKLGDKIATVSLSWGGAGDADLLWRYKLGKKITRTIWSRNCRDAKHFKRIRLFISSFRKTCRRLNVSFF